MQKLYRCVSCGERFYLDDKRLPYIDEKNLTVCNHCHLEWRKLCGFDDLKSSGTLANAPEPCYNEPEHYHMHDMDTITFLQKGFPPEVFMGFAIGHIIKYAQRANYKNGVGDFEKMYDYARRAYDWYLKTTEKS